MEFASDVAEFVAGVRSIPTRGRTFAGSGRGGDLTSQDEWLRTCFARSRELLDVPPLERMWSGFRQLTRGSQPDVMAHTDLVPGNVLVSNGRLTGVIDVGGLRPADPALDLIAAWHMLEPGPRQVFRETLGCHDDEWERGKAWAFAQAMGLVWYYAESNPTMCALGRRTLQHLVNQASA